MANHRSCGKLSASNKITVLIDQTTPYCFPSSIEYRSIPNQRSRTMMAPQGGLERFTETGKKVVCAGLNYKSFALKEKLPHPQTPVIFQKATTSYVRVGQDIKIPAGDQINGEVELGVVIGKRCSRVSQDEATDYIGGYCLALDLTNITLLNKLRAQSGPWELAKAFDSACPVSAFIPKESLPQPQDTRIWMKVNGDMIQDESTSDMIFSIRHLVSYISQYMTLEPGDVLLTGTPAGPPTLRDGDEVECGIGGVQHMKFAVKVALI